MAEKAVHYEELAENYEEAAFYADDSDLQNFQIERFIHHLSLHPGDKLADLGGGSGNFPNALFKSYAETHAELEHKILCVDPCSNLLEKARDRFEDISLRCVLLGADEFAFANKGAVPECNKILIKEAIHHFVDGQKHSAELIQVKLKGILAGLRKRARDGSGEYEGKVVIMTRPDDACDFYPGFFEKAKAQWRSDCTKLPSADLCALFTEVFGAENTMITREQFEMKVPVTRWWQMLRNRFWSTFSHMSDEDIEAGIKELESTRPRDALGREASDYVFNDQFLFLVGSCSSSNLYAALKILDTLL